ncbi:MAG: hypothetical protein AUI36_33360 [Cyanobacteria bacterium 13_1_40CM_2_61_4]|nr:MAG: hypothetical protein AUI36_33360 [Cyanobacteria bacterium 13_1_40CM_2_61_4]
MRRTVGRPRGKARQEPKTWQAAQFDQAINDWRPIRETDRAAQFERWVRQKLGFSYDTFVASVMLRQGESDRLINAKPKDRFEILSGLLDLEPYKRLETAANDRMKAARGEVQRLDAQLQHFPIVTLKEIDAAQAAWQEAEQNLTQVQAVVMQVGELVNAARNYARWQQDLFTVQRALSEKQKLLQDAERLRNEYQEWQKLSVALPKLCRAVEDLKEAEQQRGKAQQVRSETATINIEELKHVAAGAAQAEQQAEKQCEAFRTRLELLNEILPLLREVLSCRRAREMRKQELDKRRSPQDWQVEINQLHARLQAQQEEQAKAEENKQHVLRAQAQAQASLEQQQQQLSARLAAQNEAICSRCGQPIDPGHIQRELEEAEQAVATAQREEKTVTQRLDEAERKVKDIAFSVEDINKELAQARQSLAVAQQVEKEWKEAKTKFQDAVSAAGRVPLELLSVLTSDSLTDADKLLHNLNVERTEVRTKLTQAEEGKKLASRNKSTANDAYQQALRDLQHLQDEAKRLDEGVRALEQRAEVWLGDVDPQWRKRTQVLDLLFIEALASRYASLQGVEQKYADLEKAASELNRLETQLEEINRNIENLQPEHRIPEDEAKKKAEHAKKHRQESQNRRDETLHALRTLQERQEKRQQVEKDAAAAQRQRKLYTRLAELLGRNGLQSYLLDEAVRSIAHLANETLTRVSGGQLRLHIERGEEEIVIRVTDLAFSEDPLDGQFISGSQKFRVSVALAAGIGQYAGRGVGSVRSLIIDEGFGSLDTQGRQEMIDELRNLSQFMDRIIIVSHQEDFQDRTLFPTGYILRKVDQRTQVERFV